MANHTGVITVQEGTYELTVSIQNGKIVLGREGTYKRDGCKDEKFTITSRRGTRALSYLRDPDQFTWTPPLPAGAKWK